MKKDSKKTLLGTVWECPSCECVSYIDENIFSPSNMQVSIDHDLIYPECPNKYFWLVEIHK